MKQILMTILIACCLISCKNEPKQICGTIAHVEFEPVIEPVMDFELTPEKLKMQEDTATQFYYQLEVFWEGGDKEVITKKGSKAEFKSGDKYCK